MVRARLGAVVFAIALAGTRLAFAQTGDDDLEVPAAPAKPAASVITSVPPTAAAPSTSAIGASSPSQQPAPAPPKSAPHEGPHHDTLPDVHGVLENPGILVSGYVQSEFQSSQISEDQRQQGGQPINQDRFLVRRGRLRVDRRWDWAAVALEFDGSTTRGPFFGVRRAEASLVYNGPSAPGDPPLLMLTAGLTEIPFGHELVESSRIRFFMERSTASLAFFPGEPDVGIRFAGGFRFLRYALGVMNGDPLNDRAGFVAGGRDFNKAKEIIGRIGVDVPATKNLRVAGGVSFLSGKGFNPGTDATKNVLIWRDLNENATFDQGEITAVPGTAAVPAENFRRWALGADLRITLQTVLGATRLASEVYVASNLDRGLFFADPVVYGADLRHVGWYALALQEFGKYVIAGARVDVYDPNSDFLDARKGKQVPASQTIRTLSPIVGFVLPGRARLMAQYDLVRDRLARDTAGVPTDLKNNLFTLRLQVEL